MILTQEQIISILDELLQNAWAAHHDHLPLEYGKIDASRLPLFIANCQDLATISHDITVLLSLPLDTTYYIKWQLTISEDQLPDLDLQIRPVTPNSHRPVTISSQLINCFADYFIKVGRIPNPWLIS